MELPKVIYCDNDNGSIRDIRICQFVEVSKSNLNILREFVSDCYTIEIVTPTEYMLEQYEFINEKDVGKNGVLLYLEDGRLFVPFGDYLVKSVGEFDGTGIACKSKDDFFHMNQNEKDTSIFALSEFVSSLIDAYNSI